MAVVEEIGYLGRREIVRLNVSLMPKITKRNGRVYLTFDSLEKGGLRLILEAAAGPDGLTATGPAKITFRYADSIYRTALVCRQVSPFNPSLSSVR